jgi:6-phosphogluconolactonase (cycloisomerase 2 family)
MPSWLTLDSSAKLLYCVNEAGTSQSSGNGSLTSFDISSTTAAAAAAENPKLLNEVATLAGGVASVVYEVGKRKFLAIAH